MILEKLVSHIKKKMEEGMADDDNAYKMLTPTVFFGTTGARMSDWSENLEIKHSDLIRMNPADRARLSSTDGVVMTLSCRGVGGQEDMAFLHSTVVPFVISTLDVQTVIWAMSAQYIGMNLGHVESHEAAQEEIQNRLNTMDIDSESIECLMIMAVDREVTQVWRADVTRDDYGHVTNVTDWESGPTEMGMMGFTSFCEHAQAAMRAR